MFYQILLVVFLLLLYYKILAKKRIITIGSVGNALNILSLIANKNISDIKKNEYNDINEKIINRLHSFNKNKKIFKNMKTFEKTFWESLSDSNCYECNKYISDLCIFIANSEYINIIKHIFKKFIKIPYIFYKIYTGSDTKEEMLAKIFLMYTLTNSYQISLITNTNIYTVLKRIRMGRNIIIKDKKTGKKMITRQVRYPMTGSEVCPFTNYINRCNLFDIKLEYSIMIIEKDVGLNFKEHRCDNHTSCVLFKFKNNTVKHIEECIFWHDDNYWINKYPKERELID